MDTAMLGRLDVLARDLDVLVEKLRLGLGPVRYEGIQRA